MNAVAIIGELRRYHVALRVRGGRLFLRPISRVPADLLEHVRAHKPEILLTLERTPASSLDLVLEVLDARVVERRRLAPGEGNTLPRDEWIRLRVEELRMSGAVKPIHPTVYEEALLARASSGWNWHERHDEPLPSERDGSVVSVVETNPRHRRMSDLPFAERSFRGRGFPPVLR